MNRIISGPILSNTPSPDFMRALRRFDPSLTCVWNTWKQRYVITQCIQHSVTAPHNAHCPDTCRMTYVWLVQDDDGDMIPLGSTDYIFTKLMASDTRKKYGEGPEGLARWKLEKENADLEDQAKFEQHVRDTVKENVADHRVQKNELVTLLERHNLE